jgi:hypothetical protein
MVWSAIERSFSEHVASTTGNRDATDCVGTAVLAGLVAREFPARAQMLFLEREAGHWRAVYMEMQRLQATLQDATEDFAV